MDKRTVTLIRGDGIGPEVTDAVVSILEAAGAPVAWEEVVVGREAEKADGDPLPPKAIESVRRNRIALKGPVGTPVGKVMSMNSWGMMQPVVNLSACHCREVGRDGVVFGVEREIEPGEVLRDCTQ